MHIKHIHETIEKLSQYACEEACKNKESINTEELGEVVDMIKDLACAEKDARISKAMEEADEEEKEEIKYIIKKMKEEGEDWNENDARRFYRGQPRSKTTGRFVRRGDGRRRGYEEPMYYGGMIPEMELNRDIDRGIGRMYFSDSRNGGSNMSNDTRGYEEYQRGYSEGRAEGERNGRQNESRFDRLKRSYTETKNAHKGNTVEDKQITMKETEKMLNFVLDEIDEMLEDASPEIKNLVKTKTMSRLQKIQ